MIQNPDLKAGKPKETKKVTPEMLTEAEIEGKMAAATGIMPDLSTYSESEKARFGIGYGEVTGTRAGMRLTPIFVLGALALPAVVEVASNYFSLGMRTWGLFKSVNPSSANQAVDRMR